MKAHELPIAEQADHPHEDQPLYLSLCQRTACEFSTLALCLLWLLAVTAGAALALLPVVLICGARNIYP